MPETVIFGLGAVRPYQMHSIWETNYVVVDVETTGSDPGSDRIMELGCVIMRGGEIVDEFSSLVNPHTSIPPFIANMTGISDSMVRNAPEAAAVFRKFAEILPRENIVFVGHNAQFDWKFVHYTFMRTGIEVPIMPQLCTLKLARRLMPKDTKKNLGALANYFEVPMKARHRALDDAKATAIVLSEFLESASAEHNVHTADDLLRFQNKHVNIYKYSHTAGERLEEKLAGLPDAPGVYYFKDTGGNILYVGKSKSLRKRVSSYFRSGSFLSKKISDMMKKVDDVEWTCTDTELHALILESKEIKGIQPHYNRKDKKYRPYPFIKFDEDSLFPKLRTAYQIGAADDEYFGPFRSAYLTEKIVRIIDSNFKLIKCDFKNQLPMQQPCFYYHIGQCGAPCASLTDEKEYELEVAKVKNFLNGYEEGTIDTLTEKMLKLSETMQYEKAADVRDTIAAIQRFINRNASLPPSIEKNNLAVLMSNSYRDKTIDVFLIKQGKLAGFRTVGRKAPLDALFESLYHSYYNGTEKISRFTLEDIDEISIVNLWLYKNIDKGKIIRIENISHGDICTQLEKEIKHFEFLPPMSDE